MLSLLEEVQSRCVRLPTSASCQIFNGLWQRLTGCSLLRPCQSWLRWRDVHAGACSGEPSEGDESVAALLLRLRDLRSGKPLPRARLWSELSVRMTVPKASNLCVHALWQDELSISATNTATPCNVVGRISQAPAARYTCVHGTLQSQIKMINLGTQMVQGSVAPLTRA